jgi:predicted membrane protein
MGFPEMLILIAALAAFVFEIMMLVDVWRINASTGKKILWTILILTFNLLASIIYFFGFRQKSSQISS